MPSSPEPQSSPAPADAGGCARILDEVVAAVDAGELAATSPERAYLVGAAESLRRMTQG